MIQGNPESITGYRTFSFIDKNWRMCTSAKARWTIWLMFHYTDLLAPIPIQVSGVLENLSIEPAPDEEKRISNMVLCVCLKRFQRNYLLKTTLFFYIITVNSIIWSMSLTSATIKLIYANSARINIVYLTTNVIVYCIAETQRICNLLLIATFHNT